MFNNVKVMRRITALLLASVLVFGFASCNFDDDNDKKSPAPATVTYGTASYSDFYGAWENNDGGWHSEYVVSSTMIKDNGMGVYYEVKEVAGVDPIYGYTVVFCQVAEGHGTAYTPAGNFYALGLKLSDGKLSICCPADYALSFTTLEALKVYYPATYDFQFGTGNFVTECTFAFESASYSDFYGAWENNDYGWHSEYEVSETMIKDNGMGVYFDVKEVAGVESKYGYTLVFCQVAEGHGTAYTPAGNFYALALKLSDGKLSICCPLDYAQNFTTLDALKAYYPATCDIKIGTSNFVTLCTVLEPSDPSVTVSDEYGTTVSFKAANVSCTMAGVGGSTEVASFTPVRDTSKETGDVLFYVYSAADRSLVADLLYIAVKKSGDKNVVYLYVYDEDEDENTYEPFYPDFMPEMTDEQLAQLKTLIPGTSE